MAKAGKENFNNSVNRDLVLDAGKVEIHPDVVKFASAKILKPLTKKQIK